jgi:hypothetical protein
MYTLTVAQVRQNPRADIYSETQSRITVRRNNLVDNDRTQAQYLLRWLKIYELVTATQQGHKCTLLIFLPNRLRQ